MTTMTVNQLLEEIYKGIKGDGSDINDDIYLKEHLLESLDFARGNAHLKNPLNTFEEVFYFRDREEPLTGDEIVEGDFLLFDSCGHNGTNLLISYESVEEMEKDIMSEGGISNMFTSDMIVIENGFFRDYEVRGGRLVWL